MGVRSIPTLIAALISCLALAPAADPAVPKGAPAPVRTTVASDHAVHPGSETEWWIVRLFDHDSRAWLRIDIEQDDDGSARARILRRFTPKGYVESLYLRGTLTATRQRLVLEGDPALGAPGRLEVTVGEQLSVTASGDTLDLAARIEPTAVGPAALNFDVGTDPAGGPARLSWTLPIAAGRATGQATMEFGTSDLQGWDATYEHGWQTFEDNENLARGWEIYVVRRGGTTTVLAGLNRADTITGTGARDAQWIGVLAHARGTHLRWCHPQIRRHRWRNAGRFSDPRYYPTRILARCGTRRVRFDDVEQFRWQTPALDSSLTILSAPALLGGHGRGWGEHRTF